MDHEHESEPEYYEGSKLSQEASRHRSQVEAKLESLYAESRNETNFVLRAKLMVRADILEVQLSLQGANPKKVPFEMLKEHIHGRYDDDAAVNNYRGRIKNRATAIRAYCVGCMGGDVAGVRYCESLTCPLHPFRMGRDPFRGFDIPKLELPDFEEDDDTGEFEEGDDGSDADADK